MVSGINLPRISLFHLGDAIEIVVGKVNSAGVNPYSLPVNHVSRRVIMEIGEPVDGSQLVPVSIAISDVI